MEETQVIIVGAGPSGLSLALSLAHRKVKSIILESNEEICLDPRAIALAGDTTRIFNLLGVTSKEFRHIGQPINAGLNFHFGNFTTEPYFTMDHSKDWMEQGVFNSILIVQPRLEQTLRDLIKASEYAELRTSCLVTSCSEPDNNVEVTYTTKDGSSKQLKGKFLVGADGKRGIVRKHFLEPRGIKQETGAHDYQATWVAANLRITIPTPDSHPNFPLWQLNYKPEELWDLFWPEGFHFCNHPTMPVAAGRFGPVQDRFFRFEYELPAGYQIEDVDEDLKTQLTPHLRINPAKLRNGTTLAVDHVEFPWNCIEIIRCRPAFFVHKVANRWFHERVLLIGDAAHVFPPFGGQGIANGVRDAFALAWRLGLIFGEASQHFNTDPETKELFEIWSSERRRGVDQSTQLTMQNGDILLNKSWLLTKVLSFANAALQYSFLRVPFHRWLTSDVQGYRYAKRGYYLFDCQGGSKMAQIWVTGDEGPKFLSDELFWRHGSILTLLVIGENVSNDELTKLDNLVQSIDMPELISPEIITVSFEQSVGKPVVSNSRLKNYRACTEKALLSDGIQPIAGYDPSSLLKRFRSQTRFALIRPDFIIFSQAATLDEIASQLRRAQSLLTVSERQTKL